MAAESGVTIHGTFEPRFKPVRDEFARNFAKRHELGASFAVMIDGALVVDLWGGWVDEAHTRPWDRDTLVCVHSLGKGFVTMAAHLLAERGAIDFDAPVTRYWPEFGTNGKKEITFRQLISHQAGLPVIDASLPEDGALWWETIVRSMEDQAPIWEPGTIHGYHAFTWGYLVGEVIRRATGKTPGAVIEEELAGPWDLDFHLGCGPELDARIAYLADAPPDLPAVGGPSELRDRAFMVGRLPETAWKSPDPEWMRRIEIPSGNGHCNAVAVARAFGGMARGGELDGVRLLAEERVPLLWEEQASGLDAVIGMPTRYALGMWLTAGELTPWRVGHDCFAHPGSGGAYGLGDATLRMGVGYAMNREGGMARRLPLERALYACLEDEPNGRSW